MLLNRGHLLLARGICCLPEAPSAYQVQPLLAIGAYDAYLPGVYAAYQGVFAAYKGHHLLTRGICCLPGASSAYQGHLLLTKGIICLPGAYAARLPGMYVACQGRLLLRRVGGANAAF